MTKILFRGKTVEGKWVYGYYIRTMEENDDYSLFEKGWIYDDEGWCRYEVIPETVGQYTGIDDKNGVKIFEGDVVECISTWDKANMVVIFEDGEYRLVLCDKYKNYTPGSGYYSIGCFDKKVIGNIHDNQELKGETK